MTSFRLTQNKMTFSSRTTAPFAKTTSSKTSKWRWRLFPPPPDLTHFLLLLFLLCITSLTSDSFNIDSTRPTILRISKIDGDSGSIDPLSPVTLSPPVTTPLVSDSDALGGAGVYFGYAIAQLSSGFVLVGAPRASVGDITRHGAIYKCDVRNITANCVNLRLGENLKVSL